MARITIGPTCWKLNDYPLGGPGLGGYVICKSGGVAWIVAPLNTEVTRNRFSKNDAVTTAQASAACGDWFIPSYTQLQNPGYCCRNYWDSYSLASYYSNSSAGGNSFCVVSMVDGSVGATTPSNYCARAFRCVTY